MADFESELNPDPEGPPFWTWKPVEEGNEDRVLRLVADGVNKVSNAAEELGITPDAVFKIKQRLQHKGQLLPGSLLVLPST